MLAPNALLQNRYLIVRAIGQGGMGAVYLAKDQRLGHTVALKETFFQDPRLRRAFEREARLLAGLRHPALPVVSDYFAEEDGEFLVMQFIPGDDLEMKLQLRGQPFPVAEVLDWADQLLGALAYLHSQEPPILHRDIKPANLKLTSDGQIVLLDFGLAKGSVGMKTSVASRSVLGFTPNFAPLEQIQGAGTNERSDLYSLAATLYNLLTGQVPADALSRASALVNGTHDPLRAADEINKEIPSAVANVLHRALSLRREQRPTSAVEMRRELRASRAAQVEAARTPQAVRLPPTQLDAPPYASAHQQSSAASLPPTEYNSPAPAIDSRPKPAAQLGAPTQKMTEAPVSTLPPTQAAVLPPTIASPQKDTDSASPPTANITPASSSPRNTRGNEIVAILLCALGLLLALCLLPISYHPNDPSWNIVAGQPESASNWLGVIGANVAETLFQLIGLAAYLLPVFLFAAAWQRFRTRRIHAPLSRIMGLTMLLLASAALLHLFRVPRPFGGKFEPGGLAGALVSGVLESGLNAIGAGVLLFAAAGIGLLLATNFSFGLAFDRMRVALTNPFASLRTLPERFRAWRAQR